MTRERERNLTNIIAAQLKSRVDAIKKQLPNINFSKFKVYDFNDTANSSKGISYCDFDQCDGCDDICDSRW